MTVYSVDNLDNLKPLANVPQMDTGAPLPILMQTEQGCCLAYLCRSAKAAAESVAIINFEDTLASYFGEPNDEALAGHPLYDRGLSSYSAFEVTGSSWIRALENANRAHRLHSPESYAGLRHFIWTFHDSTFECVASDYGVETIRGSIESAVSRLKDCVLD
jgi:hypothetical protein